jgi:hypothetical protein
MTGKVIRLLFISALLFVNAYIYFLALSPNEPRHLSYIPADARMSISVNTRQISGKMAYSMLFDQEEFNTLLADREPGEGDFMKELDNGTDLFSGRITMALIASKDSGALNSVVFADLASEKKLRQSIEKDGAQIEALGENSFVALKGDMAIGFNHEIALMVSGPSGYLGKKEIIRSILAKENPNKEVWPLKDDAHDFNMFVHPGIETMQDAPALKGVIGSFIKTIGLEGTFRKSFIEMDYSMETDPALLADASQVFSQHDHLEKVPEEMQDGIFHMHMTFHPQKWVEWIEKGDLLGLPDSVQSMVYGGLKQTIGDQFVMEVDGARIFEFKSDSAENKMNTMVIPEFKVSFTLKDQKSVKELMEFLVLDSVMLRDSGGVYKYPSPSGLDYYFLVQQNVLALSTSDRFITNVADHFKGFSNYMYFNVQNFIDAIPGTGNPIGFIIKRMMDSYASIHYGYAYSVGASGNKINWKGRMYFSEKENHSLIETIFFLERMAAVVIGTGPVEDAEEDLPLPEESGSSDTINVEAAP